MKVQKTTNYDQFKKIGSNREINYPHLKRLLHSISEKNLLEHNPILVNDKNYVVDGQHRLEAAKRLSLPIYYTVVVGDELESMQRLNVALRPWSMKDYLHTYVSRGYPDYQILEGFMNANGLSASLSMYLLSGESQETGKQSVVDAFKTGEFKVSNLKGATKLASRLHEIKDYVDPGVWQSREFIRALTRVYKVTSHKKLMTKLRLQKQPIHRQAYARNYLRVFEDVLNFRTREENHVRLY